MSKTVTITLSDNTYAMLQAYAEIHNRSIANFIETSALRYIEEYGYVDEFEMAEIKENQALQAGLQRALREIEARKSDTSWPQEIRELAGAWPDFPLVEELRKPHAQDIPREPF